MANPKTTGLHAECGHSLRMVQVREDPSFLAMRGYVDGEPASLVSAQLSSKREPTPVFLRIDAI